MTLFSMGCEEAGRMISQKMDARISLVSRLGLRIHLMMCEMCTQAQKQMAVLRKIASHFGSESEIPLDIQIAPDHLKERLKKSLRED